MFVQAFTDRPRRMSTKYKLSVCTVNTNKTKVFVGRSDYDYYEYRYKLPISVDIFFSNRASEVVRREMLSLIQRTNLEPNTTYNIVWNKEKQNYEINRSYVNEEKCKSM